ncbi:MAG: glycosyltransferase [Phycisphaerales bacterium]|nr:glycosyltransferase [Phycisphaerales bacterium]
MTAPSSTPRIALAHDWLVGYRGGEGVLDCVARLVASEFQPGSLYALFDDGRPLTPAIDAMAHRVSWLNRVPKAKKARRWLLPLYHAGVRQLSSMLASDDSRARVDLLVSTSSAAVHALRAPRDVPHLCYCHSPPRYLWHLGEQYSSGMMGVGLRVCSPVLRRLDACGARRVTTYLANSTHTREMIRRCYDRDAEVVFPPVRTEYFIPRTEATDAALSDAERRTLDEIDVWAEGQRCGAFVLCAGALEPYKKTDLAIDAVKTIGRPLVIAGNGSQRERLEALAAGSPLVKFLGRVSDAMLRALYQRAGMLLFPQLEDFGIIALEAQACGTPVVALGAGGALDSVVDGETGVHFAAQNTAELASAIERCGGLGTRSESCRRNAERFSEAVFQDAMRKRMASALAR